MLNDNLFYFFFFPVGLFLAVLLVCACVGFCMLGWWAFRRVVAWVLYQVCLGPVIPFLVDPFFSVFYFFWNYRFSERWPEARSYYFLIFSCLTLSQQKYWGGVLAVVVYAMFIVGWWYWVLYYGFSWIRQRIRHIMLLRKQKQKERNSYKWR